MRADKERPRRQELLGSLELSRCGLSLGFSRRRLSLGLRRRGLSLCTSRRDLRFRLSQPRYRFGPGGPNLTEAGNGVLHVGGLACALVFCRPNELVRGQVER